MINDNEGNLWIGTLNKGLHKLSSTEAQFYPIQNEEQAVHLIYKRNDTLIYADVASNLYYYNGKKFECFFKSPLTANPKNIYFDNTHQVYVFSGNDLQFFSPQLRPIFYQQMYGNYRKDKEGFMASSPRVGGRFYFAPIPSFYNIKTLSNSPKETLYEDSIYRHITFPRNINIIKFDERFRTEDVFKWKDFVLFYRKDTLYYHNFSSRVNHHKVPISGKFQKVEVLK